MNKKLPDNYVSEMAARVEESDQSITLFFNAVRKNNLQLVKKLLRNSPLLALEVNDRMQTVLHVAVVRKNLLKMVVFLLELDCSSILLKSKDISGKTPFQLATDLGDKEILQAI